MNIIKGTNVDLIAPFPQGEVKRIFGWNHCYRTLAESDDVPNTMMEFTAFMEGLLGAYPSWGIIDKNHLTNARHEAPLVGVIFFEPFTLRGGYIHFASARKAWKAGLLEEALILVVNGLFENAPSLARLGFYLSERNTPAKQLAKKLGFKFEGLFEDMIIHQGKPEGIACFGLTRRAWTPTPLPEGILVEEEPEDAPISLPLSAESA
jgi:RimJ/RimL family protein N-acetyltransferase